MNLRIVGQQWMARNSDFFQCEWIANPDPQWLKGQWMALEARAEPNLFLSWLWIGTWLDCFVDDYYVVLARNDDTTVGLGIIVIKAKKLATLNVGRQFCLHRTGDPFMDQIWIEYNDFLLDSSVAALVRPLMTACVMANMKGTDTFVVGASEALDFLGCDVAETGTLAVNGVYGTDTLMVLADGSVVQPEREVVWDSTAYRLDFSPLRAENQTLDRYLSRNARYQIKRSLKKYQALGTLKITTASSVTQGLHFFEHAAEHHLKRWGRSPHQSGFANPNFLHFHQELIRRGFPKGQVVLHHLQAGQHDLGVIYNFHYDHWVHFYLSALNYEAPAPCVDAKGNEEANGDRHLKPGLVAHYLLIEEAMAKGFAGYDFMGGQSRYKQTFANQTVGLAVYHYRFPHVVYAMKKVIRGLKRRVWSQSSSGCP
ncbi:GNAT family N-acetyltransferase (plasmid) [Photobacterium sp. GJ3]|uniref:GNAT family N-acetyltransferase n=1 Tax=Photobacterium sp. GJ3 TaxID=2829502 RepID=UPI001B8BA253|nr:GNAT family N-acetyltransferase [Photobacterium sp. GJ3]QUJ69322.1 GNAT family N-acetyltransferase [Photobacterium sp. GJ3]